MFLKNRGTNQNCHWHPISCFPVLLDYLTNLRMSPPEKTKTISKCMSFVAFSVIKRHNHIIKYLQQLNTIRRYADITKNQETYIFVTNRVFYNKAEYPE